MSRGSLDIPRPNVQPGCTILNGYWGGITLIRGVIGLGSRPWTAIERVSLSAA